MVYITALTLTKVSILFFYLKVFPGKGFRWCVYVLIACNACYAIVFDFLLAFQCNPIPGAWMAWDGTYPSKCISINLLGWSAAGINILLDLCVIILPLPELFRLSMSLRKKVQIIMMFAVGFFVTFVSIIRLRSLVEFGNTQNVTRRFPIQMTGSCPDTDARKQRTTSRSVTGRRSRCPWASSARACPPSARYSAWCSRRSLPRAGRAPATDSAAPAPR
jgi:hypothetical protein